MNYIYYCALIFFHPVHGDAPVGAHNGARGAADARVVHFAAIGIAPMVHLVGGECQRIRGARHDAEVATLAAFHVHHDSSFHFCHSSKSFSFVKTAKGTATVRCFGGSNPFFAVFIGCTCPCCKNRECPATFFCSRRRVLRGRALPI